MALLIYINVLNADVFQPSHSCYTPTKPFKPYSFNSQWEVDSYNSSIGRYNNEVEDYRTCINDFIDDQKQGISNHKNAAQNALDDWDLFVSYN